MALQFIRGLSVEERIRRQTRVDSETGCIIWTGNADTSGYGRLKIHGRHQRVHRLAYELARGPIPAGLQIDHLCRVRECANPDHMEPVTGKENLRRSPLYCANKTHCPQGHPYAGDNLYVARCGARHCRACKRIRSRRYKATQRQQVAR